MYLTGGKRAIMSNVKEFYWKCKGGMLKLKEQDISYIHTEQRNIYIHTGRRVYQIYTTLRKEEEHLQELPVIRVHQGYLIHLDRMESLIKNELIMRNGDKIPVSESRKKYVLEQVILYLNKEGKYKYIR